MTGQPVLGDFLRSARQSLERVTATAASSAPGRDAEQISASFRRVITALAGYAADLVISFGELPEEALPSLHACARAALQTSDALSGAAACLRPAEPAGRQASQARRFADAAASLRAGRDLLQTHFGADRVGARRARTSWGVVISTPAMTSALLAEIASLSGQAAAAGQVTLPDAWLEQGTALGRRMQLACQWLAAAHASGQLTVTPAERDLLQSIPATAVPPRRTPDGTESVPGLCAGILTTSQRVSHLAWTAARAQPGSPAICVHSWRRIASAGTATSHHCHLLLTALAARAADHQPAGAGRDALEQAAARARQLRAAWLRTGRALAQVTTDVRWHVSRTAAEAGELALWTGRLAYASPRWVPADGPDHPVRPPADLAPAPGDTAEIVAAVHYTTSALERLAMCTEQQVRQATRARRILLPAKLFPERYDAVRLFSPAPEGRVTSLLSACHTATGASASADNAVSGIAADIGAPSTILTTAKVAIHPAAWTASSQQADAEITADRNRAQADAAADRPGPTETRLRDMGVTSPRLLWQASSIDGLVSQVMADAAVSQTASARPVRRPSGA